MLEPRLYRTQQRFRAIQYVDKNVVSIVLSLSLFSKPISELSSLAPDHEISLLLCVVI